ncbi:3-phosphoshikimate 1-carboxyvinyltransferase [Methanotrichaceae archaeon M04Ac]|uniref:3-phosphoshikimate 1-carboxyvinyltransferase n=1 Tax=Candidatus Methanocrinis alkalitolerans TaxID=3033395 RepID=A0ABT5XG56_9EURY|nr:3-phosphoshikimate 1-carboxyvinyltransferase [Candidatus Methanocrinis alkalitolerans]MCR3883248.1 3-phosphoshikimate 1-carboxyvinyltransferase [Methanothrix sp.]MDF0593694.1 3-phosphoshikimate 1-carboxyvinyltransferase [Candidatus Methanocrinis alkalitolerans]
MIASVERSQVSGEVAVPPSKSYTHRAITISALGTGGSVKRPLLSADTRSTIAAAEALGAGIEGEEELLVAGVRGRPVTPDDVIDVDNSGTTLRIISAVAALTDGAVLTGDASIRRRPNGPLLKSLCDLGAEAFSIKKNDCAPLVVRGRIRGGRTILDGRVSSQFLSALLISCPLAEEDSEIVIDGELKSRPYAEITLEMLEEAGAKVETDFGRFFVPGGQSYRLERYTVPGDFSSASYLLAAAAVTGSRLVVRGLRPSKQGDSAIVTILREMGAKISWKEDEGDLTIEGGDLEGVEVDASLTPDLVPTIAVLGSLARGRTVVKNAEHVRHKETDRLSAMAVELSKMGADIEERADGLVIKGGKLEGARVSGHHDHRIVMALTVAGLVAGDTRIDTAESVSVSYPGFFEDMAGIGCRVQVGE